MSHGAGYRQGMKYATTRGVFHRLHMVRTAGLMALMSAAGSATGLALDAVILSAFGAGAETDALFAAMTIPALLIGIVSIQSPKVFVPVFGALFESNDDDAAWALLRNLLTVGTAAFATAAALGVLLSGVLIPAQIPGLDSAVVALAIQLSRVCFLLVVVQSVSSMLSSVLYAKHHYAVASSQKLVTNLVTLAVAIAGHRTFGIYAIAWGSVLASTVHLARVCWVLRGLGFRYHWRFDLRQPQLRDTLGALGYPFGGHVLGESAVLVQNVLGSFLGSGSVTLVRYSHRVVQAAAGILLGSVVKVVMPTMARHAVSGDARRQRQTLLEGIQLLAMVGVPICAWLILTAQPLVVVLFQRGEFSASDAALTALILQWMVPDLLLGRLVSVTQTLFYCNGDQRTPFVSTVLFTIVNAVTAVVFTRWVGVQGVGMAISLASVSNTIYMLVKLKQRFSPMGWSDMHSFAVRLGMTTIAAAAACVVAGRVVSVAPVPQAMAAFFSFALPTIAGFGVFGIGVLMFRLFDPGLIRARVREAES